MNGVRLSRRELFALGATLVPVSRILAWQESAAGQQASFSTNVNVLNVLVSVRDKQGKIVHDLTKDDFTLDEAGHPQTIKYFAQQTDMPLTLGLLVDTSGSQLRVLDEERRASLEFFRRVMREDKDQAFTIHFDREVERGLHPQANADENLRGTPSKQTQFDVVRSTQTEMRTYGRFRPKMTFPDSTALLAKCVAGIACRLRASLCRSAFAVLLTRSTTAVI